MKGKAHLIPIQITLSKHHSDSVTAFFSNWKSWIEGLSGYDVDITFLWICEDGRDIVDVEGKERGDKMVHPPHTVSHITVMDLNQEIGYALAAVRN